MAEAPLERLVEGVLEGETAAIAQAITRVEDTRAEAAEPRRELIRRLEAETPSHHTVVGLTGPPGAGKSSLAAVLIERWSAGGAGVGMLAIDPSSRRSGGALLGDRARMRIDPSQRVFVRSMAAGEQLGGLAPAARAATAVLRCVFPWTLVETVGVGQSEVDVETVADTVVVVLQPGSGDTLQFMKAGILEIPDVFVVHKWDLGAVAEQTRADLESILALRSPPGDRWRPPVLGVSSLARVGIDALLSALVDHRAHLDSSGELAARRERNRALWAVELFAERYGTLGIEQLGGREALERQARDAPGTALDAFSDLARRAGLEPPRDRDR